MYPLFIILLDKQFGLAEFGCVLRVSQIKFKVAARLTSHIFNGILKLFVNATWKEKAIKNTQIGKEDIKLPFLQIT